MKKMLSSALAIILFVSPMLADIYVIHSCSGAGKDTIVAATCNIVKGITFVPRISTRAMRPNEKNGVDVNCYGLTSVAVDLCLNLGAFL